MRDDKKVIRFDFEFKYPLKGGGEDVANCITVCEPPYAKRDVHWAMQAYLGEAQKGIIKAFSGEAIKQRAQDEAVESGGDPDQIDALVTMKMGLGFEGYPRFVQYVQKALTGTAMLAFVGEDVAMPDRVAISDLVWTRLAEAGGMAVVDSVVAEFASFFSDTRAKASPVTNGTDTSVPLATATQASSLTTMPARKPRFPVS